MQSSMLLLLLLLLLNSSLLCNQHSYAVSDDSPLSFLQCNLDLVPQRSPEKRQELPPALDQLLAARIEAWNVLSGGGRRRHQPSSQAGQQVILFRAFFFPFLCVEGKKRSFSYNL
jgi:hypothetical protein